MCMFSYGEKNFELKKMSGGLSKFKAQIAVQSKRGQNRNLLLDACLDRDVKERDRAGAG